MFRVGTTDMGGGIREVTTQIAHTRTFSAFGYPVCLFVCLFVFSFLLQSLPGEEEIRCLSLQTFPNTNVHQSPQQPTLLHSNPLL